MRGGKRGMRREGGVIVGWLSSSGELDNGSSLFDVVVVRNLSQFVVLSGGDVVVQERLVSGEYLSSVLVRFDCAPQGEVHQIFSLDDRLGRAEKKRTDTALSVEQINLLEGQTLGLRDKDCGRER